MTAKAQVYWETEAHKALLSEAANVKKDHLRHLLSDNSRNGKLVVEADGILYDIQRQQLSKDTLSHLLALASQRGLKDKIAKMFSAKKINTTEDRAVLHTALRCPKKIQLELDGKDVIVEVHDVLQKIKKFTNAVRGGMFSARLPILLSSYLGPEFVFEALRTDPGCAIDAAGRNLRFLANVDPIDVTRATFGLSPETTLIVVVSKTFTTAETMLNARTLRHWLIQEMKDDAAIGCVPLALQYGYDNVESFLNGCHAMDVHFRETPLEQNLPVLAGLISVWNSTYLGYSSVAVLPYCQALCRFAAHIQQLTMESNGKGLTIEGSPLPVPAGEIFFGEPGTNGQHSFYQLLHQGRVVPAEFIGFIHSQTEVDLEVRLSKISCDVTQGEPVCNHDELMANFFAQPDALAYGRSASSVRETAGSAMSDTLVKHRTFEGNRPSSCLLMEKCTPFEVGRLLALYEHRTAVQGFIWGVNSFDQWGVELGKILANDVRGVLKQSKATRSFTDPSNCISKPTRTLLERYIDQRYKKP